MSQVNVEESLRRAVELFQAGRLEEVEALCRQVLAEDEHPPFALQLLVMAAHQAQLWETAISLLGQAIALQPMWPETYNNLGLALQSAERVNEAVEAYQRAYLELYHQIDIDLDPFPCNGHTVSLDAMWMGVPIVTWPGPTAVGRAGYMQLTHLGLPELIAGTGDDYVAN